MQHGDEVEVIYSPAHWTLLKSLRRQAAEIMTALSTRGLKSSIYGSVTRGDVDPSSDIDIIIPFVVSSIRVELALTGNGFKIFARMIAQATPRHAPKAHIYVDAEEKKCVTFPLVPFRSLELEFYKFGGILDLPALHEKTRVAGCDKRLMVIQPRPLGHLEFPIQSREVESAKMIGVSLETVTERVRVLMKRQKVGRTGLVLSKALGEGDVFEDVLRRLADSNPIVKRTLRERR